jgi:hypothetical protein
MQSCVVCANAELQWSEALSSQEPAQCVTEGTSPTSDGGSLGCSWGRGLGVHQVSTGQLQTRRARRSPRTTAGWAGARTHSHRRKHARTRAGLTARRDGPCCCPAQPSQPTACDSATRVGVGSSGWRMPVTVFGAWVHRHRQLLTKWLWSWRRETSVSQSARQIRKVGREGREGGESEGGGKVCWGTGLARPTPRRGSRPRDLDGLR